MTVREIKKMGHPVLRRPADAIEDPTAPEIKALVEDMVDSMREAGGIGIAAPQIGVSKRVVMFHVPDDDAPGNDPETRRAVVENPLTVLINPTIDVLDETEVDGWEGCLSVPGLTGIVPRYKKIRYTGVTPDGEKIDRVASDFHARVVQHECDHVDGILYPYRMTSNASLMFTSEIEHLEAPPTEEELA
ncbi:MAG TPA: peptide deformylase [Alphaproteobacteria bacterium]|nr:peptide deformylase [Alphaproteobacteria bacterium]